MHGLLRSLCGHYTAPRRTSLLYSYTTPSGSARQEALTKMSHGYVVVCQEALVEWKHVVPS